MPPRPYQSRDIAAIERALRGSPSTLYVAPTGSGKTFVAEQLARGRRTLYLAPWREIARQTAKRFAENGADVLLLQGSKSPIGSQRIVVATVGTAARADLPLFELVEADEAHRAPSRGYASILRRQTRAKVVGLTATPKRLDGRALGPFFKTMVLGPTYSELVGLGFLAPNVYFGPPMSVDFSSVPVDHKTKDYKTRAVSRIMCRRPVVGSAVEQWRRLGQGRPTLAFCVTRAHAEQVRAAYEAAGVPALYLDGNSGKRQRAEAIERLEDGSAKVVTSVGVFCEGLDVPIVSCIQGLRPSKSLTVVLQQWGRGSRVAPGKTDCRILDHAGNIERHGFCEDVREWTLDGKVKEPVAKERPNAPRQCPSCGGMVPATARACPVCGFAQIPATLPGNLERYTPDRPSRRVTSR